MKNKTIIFTVLMLVVFAFFSCGRKTDSKSIDPNDSTEKSGIDSLSHFNIAIAIISNDQFSFTEDKNLIKIQWEEVINNNSQLDITFDDIKIFNEEGNYFLRGKNNSGHSSSALRLVRVGDKLYEMRTPGGGTTVTCSGCTSTGAGSSGECEPAINPHHGWYCTDCSQGTCTKTTTTSLRGILSSELDPSER
jgi:hypothetical protein